MKNIEFSIVGAFDRFNYGDMLFPHIIEKIMKNNFSNCTLSYYGIRNSNFSKLGAKKTNSISDLQFKKNYVIIAGGDTITAALEFLYLDNIESKIKLLKERIVRKLLRGGVQQLFEKSQRNL